MNTENTKANNSNKFLYELTNKLNLKNTNKNMAVANLSIYHTWKKSECNNNKIKISPPTSNDGFDLPDGLHSVSDIKVYFEYIIKKHETIADNPPVQFYVKK